MKKLIVFFLIALILTVSYFSLASRFTPKAPFGEGYAIVRVFDGDGLNSGEVSRIRYAAEEMSETVEGAERLWCDAYSRFETVTCESDDGKRAETPATVTGGDYFLFHPLDFVSGYYYSSDDLNFDRVVIDERLSFQLFGSNNSVDMKINVGGLPLYVAGVVALDESDAYKASFEEKPMIYIPENIAEKLFGKKDFDYYEICLQNPVTSHAVKSIESATSDMTVVDVTERFSLVNTFKGLKDFTSRSYVTEALAYPYFENADREREDVLALFMAAAIASIVVFVIKLIIFIIERRKNYEKISLAFSRSRNAFLARILRAKGAKEGRKGRP